jgi:deoxyribose-phosphate aldolase
MDELFEKYKIGFSNADLLETIENAKDNVSSVLKEIKVLKQMFNCIDLTSLNSEDCAYSIKLFCEKVNDFRGQFPRMPSVGAVCVYPVFSPVLKSDLKVKDVKKAVVAAGFPSSQTFTDIKIAEVRRAKDLGVDEVDIVISVGEFLDGNYEFVIEEIRMIKEVLGDVHLKVILETGLLKEPELIWQASILAMEGGADFIKTSTGKTPVSATPEAACVMLHAIKTYYEVSGRKVGFKPAGGIVNSADAALYFLLVKEILGKEWLNNELFRFGASRLANHLLSDVLTIESGENQIVKYF